MALAGAIFLVVGFVALIRIFGLVRKCGEVLDLARASLAVMRNPSLDDAHKERALQSHATRLFSLFVLLTAGVGLALALPAGMIWILDVLEVVSLASRPRRHLVVAVPAREHAGWRGGVANDPPTLNRPTGRIGRDPLLEAQVASQRISAAATKTQRLTPSRSANTSGSSSIFPRPAPIQRRLNQYSNRGGSPHR